MLIPALLLAGFVACSDDDDPPADNTNTNTNTNTNNNNTTNNNTTNNNTNNNTGGFALATCEGENGLQAVGCQNGQIQFYTEPVTLNAALAVEVPAGLEPQNPLPDILEANDFFGAVNPDGSDDWWAGWTYIDSDVDGSLPGDDFHPLEAEITDGTITPATTNACEDLLGGATYEEGGTVDIFGVTFPVCVVSGRLTGDASWPNDHVFLIDGTFNIGEGDDAGSTETDGPTLTIAAGTQIYAANGTFTTFVVTRGAQINAAGTAALPIIFGAVAADPDADNAITDDNPEDLSERGQWGGIALSGYGRVASAPTIGGEVPTEAAPADAARFFGGDDNADSSGTLEYVIIAETGFPFDVGEEIQGLTVEGAGSGTTISYVQVIGSDDDGIEWFGGAAGADHLVISGQEDDGLDQDDGYQGTIQYAIVIHGSMHGERGFEWDGSSDLPNPSVVTNPVIANVTIIGNSGSPESDSSGILMRNGWQGQLWRAVVVDGDSPLERGCLDVDDPTPGATAPPEDLTVLDGIFNCANGQASGLVDDDDM